jgi:hypothetical protein
MASMVPVAADVQERASTRGRADERPSGEDQREPSSRCLAALDALPERVEQIDLVITDGDAGKQRWGAG